MNIYITDLGIYEIYDRYVWYKHMYYMAWSMCYMVCSSEI